MVVHADVKKNLIFFFLHHQITMGRTHPSSFAKLIKSEINFVIQQVTAAVANFYVPTLSMLYIYGRIFRTIRQRSRNDLGEVTVSKARRPGHNQAPAIVSDHGDSTSLQAMETDEEGLEDQPNMKPLERGISTIARSWNHVSGKFNWYKSGPAALQPAGSTHSRKIRSADRSILDFYESLTLMELHGSDGARQSTTHYINVQVKVEYVDDESSNNHRLVSERVSLCKQQRQPSAKFATAGSTTTAAAAPSVLISQKERKAARQLGVIVCAFMVCWLPYFIVFLVVAVCPDCIGDTLFKITLWLGYINSTLNPVLYPLCNANFRRAFAKMLNKTCTCCRNSSLQRSSQTYPLSGPSLPLNQQSRF